MYNYTSLLYFEQFFDKKRKVKKFQLSTLILKILQKSKSSFKFRIGKLNDCKNKIV